MTKKLFKTYETPECVSVNVITEISIASTPFTESDTEPFIEEDFIF